MADISTYLDVVPFPDYDNSNRHFQVAAAIAAGPASGDNIKLFTVPIGQKWRLSSVAQRIAATFGAGAIVQARHNRAGVYTPIAGASTAAAASKTDGSALIALPLDLIGGDTIELLVSGAAISAAATATLDMVVSNRV